MAKNRLRKFWSLIIKIMKTKTRESGYKPLLFTTTLRNPERLKDFLAIFIEYDEKILTGEIIEKVAKSLIQKGLYRPKKVLQVIKDKWENEIELSKEETNKVFADNPQGHKEAGFNLSLIHI